MAGWPRRRGPRQRPSATSARAPCTAQWSSACTAAAPGTRPATVPLPVHVPGAGGDRGGRRAGCWRQARPRRRSWRRWRSRCVARSSCRRARAPPPLRRPGLRRRRPVGSPAELQRFARCCSPRPPLTAPPEGAARRSERRVTLGPSAAGEAGQPARHTSAAESRTRRAAQAAEERALAGRCGEPCCPRPLRAPRGRGFRLDAARQRVAREGDVLFCRRGARGARGPCRRSRRLCAVGAGEAELVAWPRHVWRRPLGGRGAPCCFNHTC